MDEIPKKAEQSKSRDKNNRLVPMRSKQTDPLHKKSDMVPTEEHRNGRLASWHTDKPANTVGLSPEKKRESMKKSKAEDTKMTKSNVISKPKFSKGSQSSPAAQVNDRSRQISKQRETSCAKNAPGSGKKSENKDKQSVDDEKEGGKANELRNVDSSQQKKTGVAKFPTASRKTGDSKSPTRKSAENLKTKIPVTSRPMKIPSPQKRASTQVSGSKRLASEKETPNTESYLTSWSEDEQFSALIRRRLLVENFLKKNSEKYDKQAVGDKKERKANELRKVDSSQRKKTGVTKFPIASRKTGDFKSPTRKTAENLKTKIPASIKEDPKKKYAKSKARIGTQVRKSCARGAGGLPRSKERVKAKLASSEVIEFCRPGDICEWRSAPTLPWDKPLKARPSVREGFVFESENEVGVGKRRIPQTRSWEEFFNEEVEDLHLKLTLEMAPWNKRLNRRSSINDGVFYDCDYKIRDDPQDFVPPFPWQLQQGEKKRQSSCPLLTGTRKRSPLPEDKCPAIEKSSEQGHQHVSNVIQGMKGQDSDKPDGEDPKPSCGST